MRRSSVWSGITGGVMADLRLSDTDSHSLYVIPFPSANEGFTPCTVSRLDAEPGRLASDSRRVFERLV